MPRKDPKRPRAARNAYVLFLKAERERMRRDNMAVGFRHFTQVCSARWSYMGDEAKATYREMAVQDKARYDREFAAYQPDTAKYGPKEKDPTAPKPPHDFRFYFNKDKRANVKARHPGLSSKQIVKELRKRWSRSARSVKAKYMELAMADGERYEREMRVWRAKKTAEKTKTAEKA